MVIGILPPNVKFRRSGVVVRGVLCLGVLLLVGALGGCGKKPGSVDPPPGVDAQEFPRVYPDPATDPKP